MNDRFFRMSPFAIVVGSVLAILAISTAWDHEARQAAPTPEYGTSPFFLPLGEY